jgi:hypothetical protein
LKPHVVETFKGSNDPQFAEKLEAIDRHNENPQPLIWTAAAKDILKVKRARTTLDKGQSA